eukprot:gnl/Dysnectes_brevis/360_a399_9365.p1 GENE.gnl/Dysnectes_brevis/360_a399_9365~~gnl/Dysnectes_brevis/360_a399_9365.p1  ORF type:complete len:148 (+),score=33.67 gnl/Dysnectes_brevis/360_a399_9365:34-444(+)
MEELKESFDHFDTDKSGHIDFTEFKHALSSLGKQATDEELRALFEAADTDKSNTIDFEEFVAIITNAEEIEPTELRELFDQVDSDKDGQLDVNEVIELGKLMDMPLTKAQAKEMITEADTDGDNLISFAEFLVIMQ